MQISEVMCLLLYFLCFKVARMQETMLLTLVWKSSTFSRSGSCSMYVSSSPATIKRISNVEDGWWTDTSAWVKNLMFYFYFFREVLYCTLSVSSPLFKNSLQLKRPICFSVKSTPYYRVGPDPTHGSQMLLRRKYPTILFVAAQFSSVFLKWLILLKCSIVTSSLVYWVAK